MSDDIISGRCSNCGERCNDLDGDLLCSPCADLSKAEAKEQAERDEFEASEYACPDEQGRTAAGCAGECGKCAVKIKTNKDNNQ